MKLNFGSYKSQKFSPAARKKKSLLAPLAGILIFRI
jgi:hypothetical protein